MHLYLPSYIFLTAFPLIPPSVRPLCFSYFLSSLFPFYSRFSLSHPFSLLFLSALSLSIFSLSLALYLPLFLFSFLESLTLANVKTVNKSLTVCNHIKRYMTSPRSESGESVFTFMCSVSSHQLNGN